MTHVRRERAKNDLFTFTTENINVILRNDNTCSTPPRSVHATGCPPIKMAYIYIYTGCPTIKNGLYIRIDTYDIQC